MKERGRERSTATCLHPMVSEMLPNVPFISIKVETEKLSIWRRSLLRVIINVGNFTLTLYFCPRRRETFADRMQINSSQSIR